MINRFGKNLSIPFTHVSLHNPKKYISTLSKILQSGSFILGKEVKLFEEEFASYLGTKYCVGVASGTDAILLALKTLDIGKGDEVIVPAFTFVASATPVLMLGAKPVFVDVRKDLPVIDEDKIEAAITAKTRAILVVHLYGYVCDMQKIQTLARKYKISVIEDVAQAHGSLYKKKKVGSFGDIAVFSFYPTKNLGAIGDAGAITTSNKNYYKKICLLRDHGQSKKYKHELLGYNSRLDTIQAAVLRIKLHELDEQNSKKTKIADLYTKLCASLPIKLFSFDSHIMNPAFYLFVIRTKKRESLIRFLEMKGIKSMIHYPTALPDEKIFAHTSVGSFPNAKEYAASVLSLPFFVGMNRVQIKSVVNAISEFFLKKQDKK